MFGYRSAEDRLLGLCLRIPFSGVAVLARLQNSTVWRQWLRCLVTFLHGNLRKGQFSFIVNALQRIESPTLVQGN